MLKECEQILVPSAHSCFTIHVDVYVHNTSLAAEMSSMYMYDCSMCIWKTCITHPLGAMCVTLATYISVICFVLAVFSFRIYSMH